jgi:rod shape-determining protein MreD
MINEFITLLLRFLVLTAMQVLLLNNIQLSGFINPYIYLLIILLLPVKFSKNLMLLIAFISGLAIDIFSNTAGMHAAATVWMAYWRPSVLRILAPRDGYEADSVPSMVTMGFNWFAVYASFMIVIHHLALFYIEAFTFSSFFMTLLRALLSSAASLLVILIAQFLTGKFKTEK